MNDRLQVQPTAGGRWVIVDMQSGELYDGPYATRGEAWADRDRYAAEIDAETRCEAVA